ncbi:M23 family metallopeptidase [Hephaestia sp. CMS5P-6]|nr:M23 family metallopeptidase [Hephaestia mangrovi]
MKRLSDVINAPSFARFRRFFDSRDIIFHNGRDMKRLTLGSTSQVAIAGVAALALGFTAYGVGQAGRGVAEAAGLIAPSTPAGKVARMEAEVAAMQAKVKTIQIAAKAHAATIEQRQAILAGVLSGKLSPDQIALHMPVGQPAPAVAADAIAPFRAAEHKQMQLAARAQQLAQQHYLDTVAKLRKLGIDPSRLLGGKDEAMGGPYEPAATADASPAAAADAQFRSLFASWKKLDSLEHSVIAIPSIHPIHEAKLIFSSYFGVRTDPFNGTAAMHAGVDMPGAVGTPVYATADGIVDRAGRAGGYGNLVEIDHGKGIQTRYGHLSKILVSANERVKRGEEIGLMGSTGRSTGSHLHYEVRIDGRAVNPIPFLQTANYLVAMQNQATVQTASATTTKAPSIPETED